MKILYHHRTQGQGAEGNHIREVVKALRGQGHQVDVLSPPGVDPFHEVTASSAVILSPEARFTREARRGPKDRQALVQAIPRPKRARNDSLIRNLLKTAAAAMPQACFECAEIAYNTYSSRKLNAYLKANAPELIYERYAFFCRAPSRISQRLGIPHILEVNEISGIKRQRSQTMVGLCGRYEQEIFRNVSAIVVVSDFLKNELTARGIGPDKITVMPNAINPEDFDPKIDVSLLRKSLSLESKTVITFVGMFSSWDRLDVMISAFARVKKSCPDAHLIMVGEGIQRPGLMEQTKEMGLADQISFTGKVSRTDVPRYIALADICVLFGSNPFGSPMALFEYMAMGKPVVAPGYGPVTSIVEHGIQGLIFTPDNQQQFVNQVIELASHREKRQAMGAAARARIEGQFTWENNARKIMDIYEKVKHARD
jgi:glycosyltransferase involved in cell wall biosynthesis